MKRKMLWWTISGTSHTKLLKIKLGKNVEDSWSLKISMIAEP